MINWHYKNIYIYMKLNNSFKYVKGMLDFCVYFPFDIHWIIKFI